jgi:hypothetical protein
MRNHRRGWEHVRWNDVAPFMKVATPLITKVKERPMLSGFLQQFTAAEADVALRFVQQFAIGVAHFQARMVQRLLAGSGRPPQVFLVHAKIWNGSIVSRGWLKFSFADLYRHRK